MLKIIDELIESGKITDLEYEIEDLDGPFKESDGQIYYVVHWAPTHEQPAQIVNSKELLKALPCFAGKNDDEIMYELLKQQRHNLGQKSESEKEEEPNEEEQNKEEPTKEEPTNEEPNKEEPTKEEPTKEE